MGTLLAQNGCQLSLLSQVSVLFSPFSEHA